MDVIKEFLSQVGWAQCHQEPLPMDCSKRRYIRLYKGDRTRLLMVDPPPAGKLDLFIHVATLLKTGGFRVPEIFDTQLIHGLALIEDFGTQTFTVALRHGIPHEDLYEMALNVLMLLRIQYPASPALGLPAFSPALIAQELDIFLDWYIPMATGQQVPSSAGQDLKDLMVSLWQQATAARPAILVLRDFHIDNLMVLQGGTPQTRCGLLDFQDALIGPAAYDLTSLLQDSRLDMPRSVIENCLKRYTQTFNDQDTFMRAYHVTGAQRNIKNLGIFARMSQRDHQDRYLQFIPRLWQNLFENLDHPALDDVRYWLDSNVRLAKSHVNTGPTHLNFQQ